MKRIAGKIGEEQVLRRFVAVYCRGKHGRRDGSLCADCRELLDYALGRLANCPFEPKPKCKDCEVHCYDSGHRTRIREVMKYAGIHFVRRGRLDWLVKYFLSGRGAKKGTPRR